jgi:hypothetical protein
MARASVCGAEAAACVMKRFQMEAGSVPPTTLFMLVPSSLPTHTPTTRDSRVQPARASLNDIAATGEQDR